mmetsp:Transcript_22517/g.31755  ORF Transcript_22517/g.31755 Transcript_22517/m.31755 type:complete len:166 (+) Transcript_22517:149-646(+)|eukprot:CAMPEP_0184863884 /NCGR_PEP_ID=MMETSP0580-20130426/12963_1 /TAXON_ID=1118495 /ORGANISM="Dactyliosolen fragilissimus" /LENGTH=165 /DNA_ID=CAMNT_0027362465 /DNA_START=79 /DNA_END=576 /DNA_ORIENTATION=+
MNRQSNPYSIPRAPYVDPNTQIVYQVNDAEVEGWLTKQSMWLKDWRRRYFILKGSKLFFSKNEYSSPHGMIDLAQCTTVKSADLKSSKRFSFEISTPETTYLLFADNEKEKDDWIGSVGRSIVRCSGTFQSKEYGTSQSHGYDQDTNGYDSDDFSNSSNNPYFND